MGGLEDLPAGTCPSCGMYTDGEPCERCGGGEQQQPDDAVTASWEGLNAQPIDDLDERRGRRG